MRCTRCRSRLAAFTLVELLVVIAIIALLLAIMLPSLKKAREQGKMAVCGGNLHEVAQGMLTYAQEHDCFPIILSFSPEDAATFGFCTWSYGGRRSSDWWEDHHYGMYYLPPRQRPLSQNMFARADLAGNTDLPVFRCPSDVLTLREGRGRDLSTYEDVGTSYTMNAAWWYQIHDETVGMVPRERRWQEDMKLGSLLWLNYRETSRFVILGEDPPLFQLRPKPGRMQQAMGWHRQFAKHNQAFLDGHAAYLRMDTTRYLEPEWTSIDTERESPPVPPTGP